MKKIKYIQRLDYKGATGWQVRICYKSSRSTHSKLFSDKKHGSKTKALQKAIAWRNKTIKELDIQHYLKTKYRPQGPHSRNKNNTSGIIGVSLVRQTKPSGNTLFFWDAICKIKGKRSHKAFACAKWGEAEAFKKACRYRYENEGILMVYRGSKFPCRIPVPYQYI